MSAVLAPLLLIAIAVCIAGIAYRIYNVLQAPVLRHIAITPAADSRWGVLWFMLIETVTFRTLFKASVPTWIFGWLFHVCLLLTIIIHGRFLSIPAPTIVAWLMPYTSIISYGLMVGLIGLFVRRLVVDRVRYISSLSDYMHLILLLVIAGAGMLLSSSDSVNVYEVTLFVQGLFSTQWPSLTQNYLLALHVLGACVLLCVYPFSKLFHGPLMWFNPTRSQPQRPRS